MRILVINPDVVLPMTRYIKATARTAADSDVQVGPMLAETLVQTVHKNETTLSREYLETKKI